MPVRLKDIAEELGVSVVTVSKVLHNHPDISQATRDRVLMKVKELNYQPNLIARGLVTRRTNMFGLVVPDLMHSFFAEVAKGISGQILPHGYNVLISNSQEDPELEKRHVEMFLARQVDGLILASAQPVDRLDLFERLESQRIPYVLIDRFFRGLEANYVGVDDEELGFLATEHLVKRARRNIAHLRGPEISTGIGRLNGYRRALESYGLKSSEHLVLPVRGDDQDGYEATRRLLAADPRPDGFFCWNDPVAAGAIRAVLDAGLNVPRDVAVIGAGNVHYSDLLRVPLTTVDQSSLSIGQCSAELLLNLVNGKKPKAPKRIIIPARLVIRDSA